MEDTDRKVWKVKKVSKTGKTIMPWKSLTNGTSSYNIHFLAPSTSVLMAEQINTERRDDFLRKGPNRVIPESNN